MKITYEDTRYSRVYFKDMRSGYRWWDIFKWFPCQITFTNFELEMDPEGDVVIPTPVVDCECRTLEEVYDEFKRLTRRGEV